MSSFSKVLSSTRASSMAGARCQHNPATSQLERLISITRSRAIRFERREGSAQVVQLLHGLRSIGSHQRRRMQISSPTPPHSISFGGFRTPADEHVASSFKRPASETLHTSDIRPLFDLGPLEARLCCKTSFCLADHRFSGRGAKIEY